MIDTRAHNRALLHLGIAALLAVAVAFGLSACEEDTVTQPPQDTTQNVVLKDTICGRGIEGVMKTGKTYFLTCDAWVDAGDTLIMEPGSRLVAPGPGVHTLYINGSLFANGTREQMIYMGPSEDRRHFGSWGGIQADSPTVTSFKFVRLEYGGGLRPTGQPAPIIYWLSNAAQTSKFFMEDCHVYAPIDDGFMVRGGSGHALRNTFDMIGETHGAAMNFQSGFKGTVAYNYVHNTLDQAIQIQTHSTVLYPQTDMLVHNNTIVNSGFRNPSRPGAGVIMNRFARGKIYNNIFVNCRMGINITPSADTANTEYGNNLFYASVDSLQQHFYPVGSKGRPQPTDLIQVNPLFVKFPDIITTLFGDVDPHLQAGSPALGRGNATYDPDLGAYTAKRGG